MGYFFILNYGRNICNDVDCVLFKFVKNVRCKDSIILRIFFFLYIIIIIVL